MILTRCIACCFLCLLLIKGVGQRSANWFFGVNAGIRFTSTGIVNQPISNINTAEGCASMSDTLGNLLFYTDGKTVWNKNHQTMAGGTGLNGHGSAAQSAVAVPLPGSDSIYYLFTVGAMEAAYRHYDYSIIDMYKRGGLGEVIQKNVQLNNSTCSEGLTVIKHANKKDFWIITNVASSNVYNVYLLTSGGLQSNAVTSTVGGTSIDYGITLKASPNGKFLVQAKAGFVRLFRFDNVSGVIHDPLTIPYNFTYGYAFSPDSRRLYGSDYSNIYQLTLDPYIPQLIASSLYVHKVSSSTNGTTGDLSLGPDGRIYVARLGRQSLSVITKPNDSAASCGILESAITLTGICQYGLPNFINDINGLPDKSIKVETLSCLDHRFSVRPPDLGPGSISWLFGDGGFSNQPIATHRFVRNGNDSFLVQFQHISPDGRVTKIDEWIQLPEEPKALFSVTGGGCAGAPVSFMNSSEYQPPGQFYWNFGDGTVSTDAMPDKSYNDTGSYLIKLTVQDSLGCISDTLRVKLAIWQKPMVAIDPILATCGNSMPVVLTQGKELSGVAGQGFYFGQGTKYNGSTGQYVFSPAGLTTATRVGYRFVSNRGCTDTAITQVQIFTPPQISAGTNQTITKGEVVRLSGTVRSSSSAIILQWSPAVQLSDPHILNPVATPTTTTQYVLTATDANGCSDSASVLIRTLVSLQIPNAFSPNDDNINDRWEIGSIHEYPTPEVRIFDRWGRIVYVSNGTYVPWDGKGENKPVATGTYYFLLIPEKGAQPLTGWVQLVR